MLYPRRVEGTIAAVLGKPQHAIAAAAPVLGRPLARRCHTLFPTAAVDLRSASIAQDPRHHVAPLGGWVSKPNPISMSSTAQHSSSCTGQRLLARSYDLPQPQRPKIFADHLHLDYLRTAVRRVEVAATSTSFFVDDIGVRHGVFDLAQRSVGSR